MLACAALLPNLVAAAASLCSSAPYDAEGLDWFAGFSQGDIDEADNDHVRCLRVLRENWSRVVIPSLAVTEICHLLGCA